MSHSLNLTRFFAEMIARRWLQKSGRSQEEYDVDPLKKQKAGLLTVKQMARRKPK